MKASNGVSILFASCFAMVSISLVRASDYMVHMGALPSQIDRASRLGIIPSTSQPTPLAPTDHRHGHGHGHGHNHTEPSTKSRCGTTVAEAQERQCRYDPLSVQWLPADCSLAQASEFAMYPKPRDRRDWGYWADEAGQQPIRDLSTKLDDEGYWTTNREHLVHCALMLIRLVDGLQSPDTYQVLDSMTRRAGHSRHCIDTMLHFILDGKQGQLDEVAVWGKVLMGDCRS